MPDVQPTNNPVPSDNPADARDNFKRIDEVVNSTENLTSPTRTGVQLVTLHRYNELVQPNIDGAEAAAVSAAASAAAAEAAVSGLDYQGLWPDSGGSANKGDTYQTQVSGSATGQYFTALQNTTADPVGDNINWRSVVSNQSIGYLTNYQSPSVTAMVGGIANGGVVQITPKMIDSVDISISTQGYYGGWAASMLPLGAASYLMTTKQRVRDSKSDPLWEPDGLGDHYLFSGTEYVAMLQVEESHTILQYGARCDGVFDDWVSANAMYITNNGIVKLPDRECFYNSTINVANDDSRPIIVSGEGRRKTTIKPLSSGVTAVFVGKKSNDSASRYHEFKDFSYNATQFNKTCTFLSSDKMSTSIFSNINSFGAFAFIENTEDFFLIQMEKVFMSGGVWGLKQDGFGTSLLAQNCSIEFCENGWKLNEMRYTELSNCTADALKRGAYSYDFNRSNVVMNGCGTENVWDGDSGDIGGGLFRASGDDCSVTVNNSTFWGGNNGAQNKDITEADLGITGDIISVNDNASVQWNNSSVRSFVNRGNSNEHLPAYCRDGRVTVLGGGLLSNETGEFWATNDIWKAADSGNLMLWLPELIRIYQNGSLILDINPSSMVVNHWQSKGLVNVDSLSLVDGSYRVNVVGGTLGTLPSGNSGLGLYTVKASPDRTVGYAQYQDDNGLFSVRSYSGGSYTAWSIK